MTQEEKAKAYDEALERMKSWARGEHPECFTEAQKTAEFIFPELKESEDEKIRKAVKHLVNSSKELHFGIDNYDGVKWIDILSWLEKQGEKLPVGFYYVNSEGEKFYSEKFKYGNVVLGIEKPCNIGIDNVPFVGSTNTILTDSKKKQGEQKPADKVEPKFKVRYAGNEYNVFEIKEINGVIYYGIEDEPNHIDYILPNNCEIVSGYSYGVKEKGSPYPTESAIFSEQKPTDLEEFINELSKQFPDVSFAKLSRIAVRVAKWAKPSDEEMKELLRTEYEKGRANTITERQKPVWSEEDETFLNTTIAYLKDAKEFKKTAENCITWLKSLKERIIK